MPQLKKAEKRFNLTTNSYVRLAAWRVGLREFLRFSEAAAAHVGLTMQHYQAMLVLRARGDSDGITVGELARELLIKHNSAVGLVDRLVERKLVVRAASDGDRRKVHVRLTGRGRQLLSKLAGAHRRELQRMRPVLEKLLAEISRSER